MTTQQTDDHLAGEQLVVADDLQQRMAHLTTADFGDAMGRMGVVHSSIRPLWKGMRFVGRAFTVWTRAGDNQAVHEALDHLVTGDVLVVNGEGDVTRALIGDRMVTKARHQGAVAVVIDGAVRDAEGLQELGVPVYARAVTPAGPFKHGPGRIGVPIAIGGVVVRPGDVLCGDGDGLVVIPPEHLSEIVDRAEGFAALSPL